MNDENYYKEYINKFIKRQRIISIISIVFILLSSTISVMAVSAYLYNSNEVSYNNNASGITSTNVQGAIDELYEHATDYTSMNTRVSSLEGVIKSNSTSELSGNTLRIAKNANDTSWSGLINYYQGKQRTALYYDPSLDSTMLEARNSTEATGSGILNLKGTPIKINNGVESSTIIGNTIFYNSSSPTNYNTLTINFPFANYKNANGILITRYGMYYINLYYSTTIASLRAKATLIGNGDGYTETITPSTNNTSVIFTSSMEWNRFSVILSVSDSAADVSFSYSKT